MWIRVRIVEATAYRSTFAFSVGIKGFRLVSIFDRIPAPPAQRPGLLQRVRPPEPRVGDLARILNLPRRMPLDLVGASPERENLVVDWTRRLRKTPNGTQDLFPVQAWALSEAARCGGLLGSVGVGHGKTLLDILTPMVMPECRVAVLFIPPELRAQFHDHDWGFYGAHWILPNLAGGRWFVPGRPVLHVLAYSELSHASCTDRLEQLRPDLIIADECQNLKSREAARTRRFLRYMATHKETRFCAWSGTLTKRSLKDFAHLAILALRQGAPVPLHWPTLEEWADVLDPTEDLRAPGELVRLCAPGETPRQGFHRRLVDTLGVVHTPGRSIDTPIVIKERQLKTCLPESVRQAITCLRDDWERPDGKDITEALERARCARELACGFYYRWIFPRNEPPALISEWKAVRKAWNQELREKLKHSRSYLDSPLLCADAAIRYYSGYSGPLPTWCAETWPTWVAIRDLVRPETEPVWIDDFLARDAAAWAQENVGIVWYEHAAFGQKVATLSDKPLYGPGKRASAEILRETGSRAIVASIRAQGTGKNLQAFSRQLVANPPSDGGAWEQMLGRTHRKGQVASEVLVEVYRHVEQMVAAVDKAHALADYIEEILGNQQRLKAARRPFDGFSELGLE